MSPTMWRNVSISVVLLACAVFLTCGATSDRALRQQLGKKTRNGKLFPIFQIVRFENDQCDASDSKNGTCYTSDECEDRGGTNSGTCASGYGVCCTFDIECGMSSSENCTYFESNSPTAGGCSGKICPCNNNICQLRLDFETFIISGPSTDADVIGTAIEGTLSGAGTAIAVAAASQCLTDTFVVTNAAGKGSDVICGVNTGQHMYVETNDGCTDLHFQLGNTAVGTTLASRQWNIKVTQYGCESPVRAPQGCTQWYYGASTDNVQTFNYNNRNGRHLANQDQTICVRRERGNCRICWFATQAIDFQVSGDVTVANDMAFVAGDMCCGYGGDGAGVNGYDCVMIPGAQNAALTARAPSHVCGRNNGLNIVTAAGTGVSVCSTRTPFYIRFRSDSYEFATNEAGRNDAGFQLTYTQDTTGC